MQWCELTSVCHTIKNESLPSPPLAAATRGRELVVCFVDSTRCYGIVEGMLIELATLRLELEVAVVDVWAVCGQCGGRCEACRSVAVPDQFRS